MIADEQGASSKLLTSKQYVNMNVKIIILFNIILAVFFQMSSFVVLVAEIFYTVFMITLCRIHRGFEHMLIRH